VGMCKIIVSSLSSVVSCLLHNHTVTAYTVSPILVSASQKTKCDRHADQRGRRSINPPSILLETLLYVL